jgi:hypothetical protein
MPPNSSTIFLDNILQKYSSRSNGASRADLDVLCQKNQQVFFSICEELFDLILITMQGTAAPEISAGLINTIASDLSAVVRPLWIVHQRKIQSYVVQARDLASSASKMKESLRRNTCIQECCQKLENAHAIVITLL